MIQRQVARLGIPAVLTRYTISGQDAYGDDEHTTVTSNITVVLSYVTNTRIPFDRRGTPLGHYQNMHVEFFTTDEIPSDLTDPVEKLPTLTAGGNVYEIVDQETSQIGLYRLVGYRRRE